MSLHLLQNFAPFKVDALGIVTLFGALEMDQAFGTLRQNRYFDFLPSIAPFTIIGDYICKPIPGFVLYNVTDGIMASDISAWFGRWLLVQNLTLNSSTLFITYQRAGHQARFASNVMPSLILCIIVFASMITMATLTVDGWALANTMSMTMTGFIRWFIINQRRASANAKEHNTLFSDNSVKVMCILPNGKAVTIFTLRSIVVNHLLNDPEPSSLQLYTASKILGWTCYGCHLLSLGMTMFVNQVLAVIVLLATSCMLAYGVGFDNETLSQSLTIKRHDHIGARDARSAAYARLDLSTEEEDLLIAWNLFPQWRNTFWWQQYRSRHANRSN